LQKAILSDHLPQAYLFHGPEGVGKRLAAVTLAKALNCEEKEGDCCDTCLSCRKIGDSNHPDVSVICPDGQFIRIESIRQLQRSLSYRPYEGKRRVCVLDGADRMKVESANALLKTLEEPPPDTLFILLTTERDSLLPTIVSRCQDLGFTSLPIDQVVEHLTSRLSMEEAKAVAELSQGSLGRALEMVDHEVWEKRPKIIQNLIELPSQDARWAFATAESLADLGESLFFVFPIMISWYRDLIIWKERQDAGRLINQDFCEEIKERAATMSARSLFRRIEAINKTSGALEHNVNRLLAMESLMLELRGPPHQAGG
jgi:DNA polymerase-3 subunit delta'